MNGWLVTEGTTYMTKLWRDIKGFEGFYQVSDTGDVRSVDRTIIFSDGRERFFHGKVLSPSVGNHGYKTIVLKKNGLCRAFTIHRLVANAFIPNPNGFSEVNHKDEDKLNNFVGNLEWCSHKYNMSYGTKIERMLLNRDSKALAKKHEKPVLSIDPDGNIALYLSVTAGAKTNGLDVSSVSACCRGKYKTCGGLIWNYA